MQEEVKSKLFAELESVIKNNDGDSNTKELLKVLNETNIQLIKKQSTQIANEIEQLKLKIDVLMFILLVCLGTILCLKFKV
jgi:hypothetical protein